MAYQVIKYVKGIAYAYLQRSFRVSGQVKTESIYLGPVADSGRSGSSGRTRNKTGSASSSASAPRAPYGAKRILENMEKTRPESFAQLQALYEPAHKATNQALYTYMANAADKRSRIWRLSVRLFGYYNRCADRADVGIRAFGDRRDWRDDCARELASLRRPGGVAALEKEVKNGLRSARAALTRTKNRRTWGSYRRRTIKQATARVELQELRLKRLRIVVCIVPA